MNPPATENTNLTARFTHKFASSWTWDVEGGFFESKAQQLNRPDGPLQYANGYQGIAFGPGVGPTLLPPVDPISVPATNPSFAAAFGLGPQGTCRDALTNGGGFAGLVYANQLAAGNIPSNVGCSVGHFTTYDLYARYDISENISIHASAVNVFNAKAPLDWVTYGGALGAAPWNAALHAQGAIGQFFTLGMTCKF